MTPSAASTAILPSLPFFRSADVEPTIDRVGSKVKDICYLGPRRCRAMGRTFGLMGVDWEQRVDFERLRVARLDRIKGLLRASELGSLVCFDPNNIRYITSTLIGTWSNDKFVRWSLLMQDREAIMWDFGSAARHHQIYCPWLDTRSRAGITNFRGGIRPEAGRAEDVARKIKVELEQAGLTKEPIGIDIVEPPILFALQAEGLKVVDGQQLMLQARVIKSPDELVLLDTAYARCRYYIDDAISRVKPGATTGEVAEAFPRAQEFGFADEEAAFALQLGHGVGLSIWEKPVISRLIPAEHGEVIQEGMVFALETYWPASDGYQAARIEEQIIVRKTGAEVITRFPAEQLLVAGQRYQTV